VAMLSSVLRSERAVKANIAIMASIRQAPRNVGHPRGAAAKDRTHGKAI
jgi:hypothetical protein